MVTRKRSKTNHPGAHSGNQPMYCFIGSHPIPLISYTTPYKQHKFIGIEYDRITPGKVLGCNQCIWIDMQWGRDWVFRCGILEYVIFILNVYTVYNNVNKNPFRPGGTTNNPSTVVSPWWPKGPDLRQQLVLSQNMLGFNRPKEYGFVWK